MTLMMAVIALAQEGATRSQLAHRLGIAEDSVATLLDDAVRLELVELAHMSRARAPHGTCHDCAPDPMACAGCPLAPKNRENIPL